MDREKEDEERDERGDARSGVANEIGAQHPGNGAAGPNGGDARSRADDDLDQSGPDPGNQVEQEEREVPKAVFNAAPEDKEKEHVSQQVQPPAVEEHGNKKGHHGEPCRKREEGRRRIAGRDQSV